MKYYLLCFVLIFCLNRIEGSESFRCDYKYSSVVKGWLKHNIIPATWFDARLRCQFEGAVLASPTTLHMKAEMTSMINSTINEESYEIFTGIHATFSQGDYYTIDGIPLSRIPQTWAPNEPDNKDNKESCLTMNNFGDLADISCGETRSYICYRPGNTYRRINECGTVDPEYRLDTRTNSCYKLHTVPRNFSRAFMTCAAEGGHLAVINSQTEATLLRQLFAKYPASSMVGNFMKEAAFIGFHDWGELWDFNTIHGQTLPAVGFSQFSEGEPNNYPPGESCGAIYRSGLINDLWCNKPVAFICEKSLQYPEICRAED